MNLNLAFQIEWSLNLNLIQIQTIKQTTFKTITKANCPSWAWSQRPVFTGSPSTFPRSSSRDSRWGFSRVCRVCRSCSPAQKGLLRAINSANNCLHMKIFLGTIRKEETQRKKDTRIENRRAKENRHV
jgi:hypothetical protein